MKHLLVFGTLRVGDYNYNRFGGNQTYIKTFQLNGFSMFSLGPFPCVVKDKPLNTITVELHSIEDAAFEHVNDMEVGAGYIPEQIKVDGVLATIYVYKSIPKNCKFIESGDWFQHKKI